MLQHGVVHNRLLPALACVALAGCSVEPLYGSGPTGSAVSSALSTINIAPVDHDEGAASVTNELDAKTRQSTRFAVLVLREEDKAEARRHFSTPLLFAVQEAKGLEYDSVVLYRFVSDHRAAFLTLNNGAFFSLFLLTMLQVHTGGF